MRLLSVSKGLFFAQQNTFKVLNLKQIPMLMKVDPPLFKKGDSEMGHHRKHPTLISCLPQVSFAVTIGFDNEKYSMVTNYWLCSWLSWSTL